MYLHVHVHAHAFYRELVWELLVRSDCSEPLLTEARKIISHNSEALYRDASDHADFITYLLNVGESTGPLTKALSLSLFSLFSLLSLLSLSLSLQYAVLIHVHIYTTQLCALYSCIYVYCEHFMQRLH